MAEVSHGYCEDCFGKQVSKMERHRAEARASSWHRLWARFH
jgi:hypothetical protein